MAILIPPPPHGKDESTQQDWFVRVRNAVNKLTDLTDGGDSTLHYHNTDRDRTNHTGTQAHTTITGGITVTITTAKLTALGTNGSMTFENGILTAQTAAT